MLVGCEACPKGVIGMGPKVAKDMLNKQCNLSGDALAAGSQQAAGSVIGLAMHLSIYQSVKMWIHAR